MDYKDAIPKAEKIFIDELVKHGSTFIDIKSGASFPSSFPFDSFPLDKLSEFVMYNDMDTSWEVWLENNYKSVNVKESIFIAEGGNWGDWDAFGERIRNAFRDATKKYFSVFNFDLLDIIENIADELSRLFMDKEEKKLRLSNDNRDYQFKILRLSIEQIQSLAADFASFLDSFITMQTILEKFHSYQLSTGKLIENAKGVIYSADYSNIDALNKIIDESNKLIPVYNELKSIDYDSIDYIRELFVCFENDHISLSVINIPKAECKTININFDPSFYLREIESQLGYLSELSHMARKEKESYELNRSSKSLFRLQIIMTISLFTSVAALFSISFGQIQSNWQTFAIIFFCSIVLTLGTYYFISRK